MLVLGAGASLAEAIARRPKKSKEHPPLDITFFQRAEKYRNSALLSRVKAQADRLGEPDLTSAMRPVSMESYLGRLFFNINHDPRTASVSSYFDAVDLYASEIISTTNWMIGKAGLLKKIILPEVLAGRKVTIITFNIDLLAENTLAMLDEGSRPRVPWSLSTGYGFSDLPRLLRRSDDVFPSHNEASDIQLLKMHGSVNWAFKHRDRNPPANLVSKPRDFYTIEDRRLLASRALYRSDKGGRDWYLFPLIVPPIYEKSGFIKMHLQEVWEAASAALDSATRVVLFGYSFPQADMHARHFFQQKAQGNPALREPTLINPDPKAEDALWDVLRPSRCLHYRSGLNYVADS